MNPALTLLSRRIQVHAREMTTELNDAEVKAQVVAKLSEKNPSVSVSIIEEVVEEEVSAIADRPVRDYLSVLTERAAKKRLKKLVSA